MLTPNGFMTLLSASGVLDLPIHLATVAFLFRQACALSRTPYRAQGPLGQNAVSFEQFVPLLARVAGVWFAARVKDEPMFIANATNATTPFDAMMAECVTPHAQHALRKGGSSTLWTHLDWLEPSSSAEEDILSTIVGSKETLGLLQASKDVIERVFSAGASEDEESEPATGDESGVGARNSMPIGHVELVLERANIIPSLVCIVCERKVLLVTRTSAASP